MGTAVSGSILQNAPSGVTMGKFPINAVANGTGPVHKVDLKVTPQVMQTVTVKLPPPTASARVTQPMDTRTKKTSGRAIRKNAG
jgi:hypothetical protein